MNHSRSGRPKKPGRVSRQSTVVGTFRPGFVDRWTSQPRTKNQATPWVWKRRLWYAADDLPVPRSTNAPPSRSNGRTYG